MYDSKFLVIQLRDADTNIYWSIYATYRSTFCKNQTLEIWLKSNHKDDYISLYPWCIGLNVPWLVPLYFLASKWLVYEILHMYGYSKVVPSQSLCEERYEYWTSKCIGWWLSFGSHRHGCQINNVDLWTWGWTGPTWDISIMFTIFSTHCVRFVL